MRRSFPILASNETRKKFPGGPYEIDWKILEEHSLQFLRNHKTSISDQASRGGLTWCEAVAVIEGRPWSPMDDEEAINRLRDLMSQELAKITTATST